MKVTSSKVTEFEPFELKITVESEEEARALYAVFNHSKNTRLFRSCAPQNIRESIGTKYSVSGNSSISDGVLASDYYRVQ